MMDQPDSNINLTVPHRRQHRRRMVLSGLVILAAGVTLGIAGTLLVLDPTDVRPPKPTDWMVRMMLGRFKGQLNLTDEQSDQIRSILKGHFEELERLREEARPKIRAVFETLKSDVDAVLTEQQRDEWRRLEEQIDREFRRRMPRGPGGRGGPGRPGEDFRDGRGPFRGRGGPREDDDRGPEEWRRDGRRPGSGRWRRRPDANEPPLLRGEQKTSAEELDPNTL